MFGTGYSSLASLLMLGEYFYYLAPADLNLSHHSLVEIMAPLNRFFGWWSTSYFTLRWGLELLAFNVFTSLAVLASVQRRKIRYLLIALGVYVLHANAPIMIMDNLAGLRVDWLEPDMTTSVIQELARVLLGLLALGLIFWLRKAMTTVKSRSH